MTPIDAPDANIDWTRWPTRFILFTGKGGVGKTTTAAALAVALSDEDKRVLIVSTDPASNLSGVFTTPAGNTPTPVPGARGLDAMDIDPQASADSYRARVPGFQLGDLGLEAVDSLLLILCSARCVQESGVRLSSFSNRSLPTLEQSDLGIQDRTRPHRAAMTSPARNLSFPLTPTTHISADLAWVNGI